LRYTRELLHNRASWFIPQNAARYFKAYTGRGVVLSLCVIVAIGGSTTVMQRRSINDLRQLTDEQQVVASNTFLLNDILLATVDAETGQRGYLLTSDSTYLTPYSAALPQITADFTALKHTPQEKTDAIAITNLQSAVDQKLAELQSTLNAMSNGGFSSAVAIVETNNGLTLMNTIRSQVSALEHRQGSDLSQKRAYVLTQINTFQNVLVVVRLSALLLVIIGMYLIGRVLYQRQELEKSKGEFIDIAAHQLRTPASIVKLHLGAMLSGYVGKLSSKQAAALRNVYDTNERAIQIIEDVLRVAKVDNKDTVMHVRPENVQQLLNDAVRSIRPALKARKQRLVRHFPKQPVSASLDAVYVRMVVENLLDNASKYSPNGATITLGIEPGTHSNFIHVTDTGVGIAKRDTTKLFKKFSRIDNNLSDNITGSGLGLYWAQQIAELHGGKITVKSKKGAGSTFTLEIPVRRSL